LRWSYVAFIAGASGVAANASAHGMGEGRHGASGVLALAIPELLAALAFLVERIEVAACAVLLLIYAAATVLSLESEDGLALLRFFFFAVTAFYIVRAHRNSQTHTVAAPD
jgi:hypothetical protein